VALLLLLFLGGLLLPTLAWDGSANIQFRFHVIDSTSSRPIEGAKIRVIQASQLQDLSDTNMAFMFPIKAANPRGETTVSVMCGAGGSKGVLGKNGRFIISHEILIEAEGYRPLESALANVVGGRRWPLSKQVFDVDLILFKNQ